MSDKFSFENWNIAKFVKGRKKMIVTVIAGGLAYFISDSVLIIGLSAALGDMAVAIAEYYCKKY